MVDALCNKLKTVNFNEDNMETVCNSFQKMKVSVPSFKENRVAYLLNRMKRIQSIPKHIHANIKKDKKILEKRLAREERIRSKFVLNPNKPKPYVYTEREIPKYEIEINKEVANRAQGIYQKLNNSNQEKQIQNLKESEENKSEKEKQNDNLNEENYEVYEDYEDYEEDDEDAFDVDNFRD